MFVVGLSELVNFAKLQKDAVMDRFRVRDASDKIVPPNAVTIHLQEISEAAESPFLTLNLLGSQSFRRARHVPHPADYTIFIPNRI